MGARGPSPTPTAILSARGSWRAKDRDGEPTLPTGEPDCPAFLKGEARKEWKRCLPLLMQMRVLTEADRSTLAMYCAAWGEYVTLERKCAALVESIKGHDLPNYPQIAAMRNSAYDRCAKAGARLGFSPADRARLKAAPEKPKDAGKGRFFKETA